MTEMEAARALREASDSFTPDVEALVRGGVARGRTRQRRRRIGTTLVAASVVGVLGAAASVGPGLLGGDDDAGPPVASDVPSPSTPGAATQRVAAVGPADVAATFDELAPGGPGTVEVISRSDQGGAVTSEFLWNDTYTSVMLQGMVAIGDAQGRCEAFTEGAEGDEGGVEAVEDCHPLEDGRWALSFAVTDPEEPGRRASFVQVFADDGFDVTVMTTNVDGDGPQAQVVSDEPPFDLDELLDLAADPAWFDVVESERRALAVSTTSAGEAFGGLFPEGTVEEVPESEDDVAGTVNGTFRWNGFAVQVTITPAIEFADDAAKRCRRDNTVTGAGACVQLADGAWGRSGRASWEELAGGRINAATVATDDGWDVRLVTTNTGGDDKGPVLAEEPPFTPEQLLEAAASDVWFETP